MKSKNVTLSLFTVTMLNGLFVGCTTNNEPSNEQNNCNGTTQNEANAEITLSVWNEPNANDRLTEDLGSTYGLPLCAATEILYYNQDMFDEAGIDYPNNDWSYDDLLAAAERRTCYVY